jgi:hypothetical protein
MAPQLHENIVSKQDYALRVTSALLARCSVNCAVSEERASDQEILTCARAEQPPKQGKCQKIELDHLNRAVGVHDENSVITHSARPNRLCRKKYLPLKTVSV